VHQLRSKYLPAKEEIFNIKLDNDELRFQFMGEQVGIQLKINQTLYAHMYLKMILNIHSTLIMGRLNRYESNIMTWVKSSNNKLIDRTARNVSYLLEQNQIFRTYEEIISKIFEEKESLKTGEALVNKIVSKFSQGV